MSNFCNLTILLFFLRGMLGCWTSSASPWNSTIIGSLVKRLHYLLDQPRSSHFSFILLQSIYLSLSRQPAFLFTDSKFFAKFSDTVLDIGNRPFPHLCSKLALFKKALQMLRMLSHLSPLGSYTCGQVSWYSKFSFLLFLPSF